MEDIKKVPKLRRLTEVPTKEDMEVVHRTIAPFLHRTPVLTSQSLNELAGCELYFKCDNF